jgi:hypothetical protein
MHKSRMIYQNSKRYKFPEYLGNLNTIELFEIGPREVGQKSFSELRAVLQKKMEKRQSP